MNLASRRAADTIAPPRGGRPRPRQTFRPISEFLSTPSARRATRPGLHWSVPCGDFYPRPPRGGRPEDAGRGQAPKHFYPRSPRGGRRATAATGTLGTSISIHALREEGDWQRAGRGGASHISIHALREEGDATARKWTTRPTHFYPRPPRGGRPTCQMPVLRHCAYFYPRPPRGGRREHPESFEQPVCISIHALREEGDFDLSKISMMDMIFLSTPSARRATFLKYRLIHQLYHFYPRPPRGGRRTLAVANLAVHIFLSTPSARRATGKPTRPAASADISIHALREEGDIYGGAPS